MKKTTLLITLAIMILIPFACKKDKNQEKSYKPRFIRASYYTDFEIFDTRNTSNVKTYLYSWHADDSIFKYERTIDSSSFSSTFGSEGIVAKNWPINLKNPVNIGGPSFQAHMLDRDMDNKTYKILSYGENLVEESTISSDHLNIPNAWTKKGVIDGYGYASETYNSSDNTTSYFFFDFNNNKYLVRRDDVNVEEGNLSDFIKTPKGNMSSHNIDFKLVDAMFIFNWDFRFINQRAFYFLDYDAQKYILVTRQRNSTSVNGKNTLQTTTWQPMSKLFDQWKF